MPRIELRTSFLSGTYITISADISEAPNGELGVEESTGEYHRSNSHHERVSSVGIFMGANTTMVGALASILLLRIQSSNLMQVYATSAK